MKLIPTAEMTLGPFFPPEFAQGAHDLARDSVAGEKIDLIGRVTQMDGRALDNLVLEIRQADSRGRFDDPAFPGWGRTATDTQGIYRFRTIKPGAPRGRIAHVNFVLLYSGLMRQLQTVMFFELGRDPVLDAVPAPVRDRLVAKREGTVYRFDLQLRGEKETPFFDD